MRETPLAFVYFVLTFSFLWIVGTIISKDLVGLIIATILTIPLVLASTIIFLVEKSQKTDSNKKKNEKTEN